MKPKNEHAVALGKLGGKVGGKRRAEVLSAERRSEIASNAAQVRWSIKNRIARGELQHADKFMAQLEAELENDYVGKKSGRKR